VRAFPVLVVVLPPALLACSLAVDLDGLTGGPGAPVEDGGGKLDVSLDVPSAPLDGPVGDAAIDSLPPIDAALLDAADASLAFVDDFARPDGTVIGNGWIQKYPPAFLLQSASVVRQYPSSSFDFVDNIVYRPPSESVLDVEVSIEVKLSLDPPGFPQLHARVQPSSVATSGQLDSYFIYIDNAMSQAYVARQHGGSSGFTNLATLTMSPPLTTTATYRLRLDVTGTNPVVLTGFVEQLVVGSWQTLQSASYDDTDSTAITTAGTVGFSGGRPESTGIYSYDVFTRTPL
jgi:hypothetical protein